MLAISPKVRLKSHLMTSSMLSPNKHNCKSTVLTSFSLYSEKCPNVMRGMQIHAKSEERSSDAYSLALQKLVRL